MSYDVFAAPVPVPESRRDTMIGIHFESQAEALDRVYTLRCSKWFLYRVSGPNGFEMTEEQIDQYCSERLKFEELHQKKFHPRSNPFLGR